MDELYECHSAWCKSLQRAVQADVMGQVLEAVEAYESLSEVLVTDIARLHNLTADQKSIVEKTCHSVDLRARRLSSIASDEEEQIAPTKEEMEDVLEVFLALLSNEGPLVFPLDRNHSDHRGTKASRVNDAELDEEYEMAQFAHEGKKVVHRPTGATYIDIQVQKVGLKDAASHANPTIVISVFDKNGKSLEEQQETAVGKLDDEPQHISFQSTPIELETSLQNMEKSGGAIYFEVYHYKSKKRKKSCRCWALLELDEINYKEPTVLALELYQKPMDPKRKQIHLFTVKDLFLHIQLTPQAL